MDPRTDRLERALSNATEAMDAATRAWLALAKQATGGQAPSADQRVGATVAVRNAQMRLTEASQELAAMARSIGEDIETAAGFWREQQLVESA